MRGTPHTVTFACVRNAERSQMAAAFFNALADSSRARAVSAGTDPGPQVHPEVVAAMREVGIDLQAAVPCRLTPELAKDATWADHDGLRRRVSGGAWCPSRRLAPGRSERSAARASVSATARGGWAVG